MINETTKQLIVENQLQVIENTIYDTQIKSRVADVVKDDKMKTECVALLQKLEKMKDEIKKILEEINKGES